MASADLNTGKTPQISHAASLSTLLAKVPTPMGANTTPEEYRKRKVALITGSFFLSITTLLALLNSAIMMSEPSHHPSFHLRSGPSA